MRRSLVLSAAVTVVATAWVGPATAQSAKKPASLRILVTNDDGVKAPGIDVLVEALRKLPNVAVTVAAPADNQTGAGDRGNPDPASITATDSTTVSGYRATAVNGLPADSVVWALRGGVSQRPDVVVSGINAGENIGTAIPVSGTVGAARTAARNGIGALAVSQGSGDPPNYPAGAAHAVAWVKSHRKEILAHRSAAPTDLVGVDNLNVPSCAAGSVRGVAVVPVSSGGTDRVDCTSTLQHPKDDVEAFVNGFASLTEMQSSAVCSRVHDASDPSAMLDDPLLNEVSGVAASRTHPPTLWVHNDSGGEPAAYAISSTGKLLGAYTVDGATNVDWEDIAVGPSPKKRTSYLYLADIGDNVSARNPIVVYRVPEPTSAPDGTGGTLTGTEKISLRYPDGPVDAESLLVDPRSGDLFIIDKEYTSGIGKVFRARQQQLVDGADITMELVASFALTPDDPAAQGGGFPGTIITGADVSPDGNLVLVRTYRRVLAFVRPKGKALAAAFTVDPCPAPQATERQGEAVGFSADGKSYFTISEGEHAPIHKFGVN